MVNLAEQMQKLEQIFDQLHDECTEAFGENNDISILALKGSCRAFSLFCDYMAIQDNKLDE